MIGGVVDLQTGESQGLQKRRIAGFSHEGSIAQIAKKRNFPYVDSMESPHDLAALPKIELHEHLDGSLRLETVLELASHNNVVLPTTDPVTLAGMLAPGPSSLEIYLKAFDITVSVMQTETALRRVAFELVEDWALDGVVYGEVRFAPSQHTRGGLSPEQVVESVLKGLEEGRKTFGVETGLILCSMRHEPPSLTTVRLVDRYRDDGVVAFDIAGAETPFPPRIHREAFDYCAEHFLSATCHAGEVTGPDYIREALVACRSLRIGHGTQLIQEWGAEGVVPGKGSVTRWLLDRRIPLEVCLSSNLQTKACSTLADHPFERFRRAGLAVTLNTDNRLISKTTLSRELELAAQTWSLSRAVLLHLEKTSLEAAFCSAETKTRIQTKYFL